jgi:hypothetical protein
MMVTDAPASANWIAASKAVVVFPAPPLGFAKLIVGMSNPTSFLTKNLVSVIFASHYLVATSYYS